MHPKNSRTTEFILTIESNTSNLFPDVVARGLSPQRSIQTPIMVFPFLGCFNVPDSRSVCWMTQETCCFLTLGANCLPDCCRSWIFDTRHFKTQVCSGTPELSSPSARYPCFIFQVLLHSRSPAQYPISPHSAHIVSLLSFFNVVFFSSRLSVGFNPAVDLNRLSVLVFVVARTVAFFLSRDVGSKQRSYNWPG